MFFVSLLRIKNRETTHVCVGGGSKIPPPPPPPEIELNKMKKIAQPTEFRLKYANKHQNTLIHVHKNVCLNVFYFSILL